MSRVSQRGKNSVNIPPSLESDHDDTSQDFDVDL